MGWLLLAAAAVAVFLFAKATKVEAVQNADGTWGFRAVARGIVNNDSGPFASAEAAIAAGNLWAASIVAEPPPVIVTPVPDPIPIPQPQPGQQGVSTPYLVVTSQGIQGGAQVEGDRVRWTAGAETNTAGSAVTANATLLERIDANAPFNAPVNLLLRKASGAAVQSRVSRQAGQPAQVWVWSVSVPPAVAGGVGVSTTEPTWKANNRLGAMRGALSTLQDM